MYRRLDPDQIVKTLVILGERVQARFPKSGLSKVCAELIEVSRETEKRVNATARPNFVLRLAILAVLAGGVFMLSKIGSIIELKRESENLSGILQGIDSAFNIVLLMGGGMLYLSSLEARWKRHQVMRNLHELRSIVHVIDMHQLPKDPSSDRPATVATGGPGHEQRVMSQFELARYLDYCSELMSITGKVAALYAQSTQDPIVVDAASDIGQITASLSNKIWQKITLVQEREGRDLPLPSHASPVALAPAFPVPATASSRPESVQA
ncbi:MAG TPA: hypothetical protein PKD49_04090 [Hyphomicrobium sp.]|nr:hypothetical protein [Hyphomicrobium sp.]